jgi:hypothetical protein
VTEKMSLRDTLLEVGDGVCRDQDITGREEMFLVTMAVVGLGVAAAGKVTPNQKLKSKYEGAALVFTEDWSKGIDFSLWKHEITMGGGGNWEFEYYINNRSNSFVENGTLMIKPTLTADRIGAQQVSGAVSAPPLQFFSSSFRSHQP